MGLKDWWDKKQTKKADKKAVKDEAKRKAGPKVLGDEQLAPGKTPEMLGHGTANAVYKTDYGDVGMQKGFYKPDAELAPAKLGVGASTIANKLGMGDLIPETKFAKHEVTNSQTGELEKTKGAVSKGVEGAPLNKPLLSQNETKLSDLGMSKDEFLNDELMKSVYVLSGDDTVRRREGEELNNDFDMKNPETQRGMNRLQWFDAVTGNDDRHGGNIVVDSKTGKVSGIDNDLILGKGQKDVPVGEMWGKYLGLPSQIDQQTADEILAVKWKDMEAELKKKEKGGFGSKSLKVAKKRLDEVQAKVKAMVKEGKVVQQWDDDTFDTSAKEGDGKSPLNYIQRHLQALEFIDQEGNPNKLSNQAKDKSGAVKPPQAPQQDTTDDVKVDLPPPLPPPKVRPPRPTGGRIQNPNYAALRHGQKFDPEEVKQSMESQMPQVPPVPTGPKPRPTGGLRRPPGYNAMRGGKVPGDEEKLARPLPPPPPPSTTGRPNLSEDDEAKV